MNIPTFNDNPNTNTDDKAYLLEARAVAILRVAPLLIIIIAAVIAVLSLWLEPDGDTLVRLAESLVSGSLGAITTNVGLSSRRGGVSNEVNSYYTADSAGSKYLAKPEMTRRE